MRGAGKIGLGDGVDWVVVGFPRGGVGVYSIH